MRIDSHQHFWAYEKELYPWMGEGLLALARDFGPQDLAPLLAACGIEGAITVQARQDEAETRWMLGLAREFPFLRGVVGWVDLLAADAGQRIAALAEDKKLVGLRHFLQDEPDDAFMLRPDFQRGIACLAPHGLVYDLLIHPRHLPHAPALVDRFPEQAFVLDHLGKPFIAKGELEPWTADITRLAEREHVSCKVSGLVTEADWTHWKPSDLRPYLDMVLEAFGPRRLSFGSDWPVCTLAASYQVVCSVVREWIEELSPQEQEAILGGTAERVYLGRTI